MKKISTSISSLLILVLACNPSPKEPVVTAEVKRIDAWLSDLVARQQIPGLTVAATRNDSLVYSGAFGFTNIDTKKPMKTSYDFHWASVSKTFVGTAIMQLVEQGKIKLDEKLITYVPYFKQADDHYRNITIRQMLNHTSGIGDVEDYEWDKPQYDEAAPERFVRGLEHDKMLFEPGKDWRYSNTAFEILGVVITRVSGMPFETYVRKNILDPLGMSSTTFIYPEVPDSLRVSGHVWAGKPMVSDVYPYNRIHAPSSTLNSNVLEMTHYAMANLHRGNYNGVRILADSTYDVLWTNSVNLEGTPKVGVSWFLGEYKGLKTVSHSGGDTGFGSKLLLIPEKNISVMLVSNYDVGRTGEIAEALVDMLLGQEPRVVRIQIGFSFAEIMAKEGIGKAKAYYKSTHEDSLQHKYFLWKEDDAALAYPGYLFLNKKMFSEALEMFKFNLEINPNSGYAYYHLGVAYSKMGDKEKAVQNIRKAIELVPDDEEIREMLRQLDETKVSTSKFRR